MDGLYEQFRIAVHTVWMRRWLALAVAWGICLIGWVVLALIPNSYEAKARVYAEMQSILPSQANMSVAERQNDLLRVKQMLTSAENLQKVVRRTELNTLAANDRELAAQAAALRQRIKITALPENLVEISATSNVPAFSNAQNARTSAAVVQTLIDIFVEDNLAGNRAQTGQSLEFIEEELKRREADLQQAEQRRVEFEQQFMGKLPGEGSIEQRMAAARVELSSIDQQLMASQSALSSLRAQLGGISPSTPVPDFGGGALGPASQQLAQLEAQLSQSLGRGWTDQHPDVIATRAQIDRIRPQAARERASGGTRAMSTPNPAYTSLRAMMAEKEAQVAAALARKNQLQDAMQQLTSAQTAAPGVVAEQARLNRDYDVLKRQYDQLLQDREQVRLRSGVQTRTDPIQVRIIEPPAVPSVPLSPNRPLLLTAILFLAIAGGIGAAFVMGQLQTTFPTQAKLEQVTGLPVLGSVREVQTPERQALKRQRLVWFGGAGGALAASYALLLVVEFWQRSMVA